RLGAASTSERPEPDVDGRFDRALGKRYPGGRYGRPERQNLARSGGTSAFRGAPRNRTHPAAGPRDFGGRHNHRRSESLFESVERGAGLYSQARLAPVGVHLRRQYGGSAQIAWRGNGSGKCNEMVDMKWPT